MGRKCAVPSCCVGILLCCKIQSTGMSSSKRFGLCGNDGFRLRCGLTCLLVEKKELLCSSSDFREKKNWFRQKKVSLTCYQKGSRFAVLLFIDLSSNMDNIAEMDKALQKLTMRDCLLG